MQSTSPFQHYRIILNANSTETHLHDMLGNWLYPAHIPSVIDVYAPENVLNDIGRRAARRRLERNLISKHLHPQSELNMLNLSDLPVESEPVSAEVSS